MRVSRLAWLAPLLLIVSSSCRSQLSREEIVGRYDGGLVGEVGVLDLRADGTLEWVGERPDHTKSRRTGSWEFKQSGRTPLLILREREASSPGSEAEPRIFQRRSGSFPTRACVA